jgi:hypothetical protein
MRRGRRTRDGRGRERIVGTETGKVSAPRLIRLLEASYAARSLPLAE